jgi:hypothetical protein
MKRTPFVTKDLFSLLENLKKNQSSKNDLYLEEEYWLGNLQNPESFTLLLPGLNNLPGSFFDLAKKIGKTWNTAVLIPSLTGHSHRKRHETGLNRHQIWQKETYFWREAIEKCSNNFSLDYQLVGFSTGALLLEMILQDLESNKPLLSFAPAFELTPQAVFVVMTLNLLKSFEIKTKQVYFSIDNLKAFRKLWQDWEKREKRIRKDLVHIIIDPRDEIVSYKKILNSSQDLSIRKIFLNACQAKVHHFLNMIDQYGESILDLENDLISWKETNSTKD